MGKPALLVLAAGMGSRYGGLKQLDEIGPNGETIIEYSVFDAIRAGFEKVVFVIRKEFEDAFVEKITSKFKDKIEVHFAYQAVNSPIDGVELKTDRVKPWGTAHAVLVADEVVDAPFAVINADDYYGVEAYQAMHDFLSNDARPDLYCLIGYIMKNTLSDNGHVNRGVCKVDDGGFLSGMNERLKIQRDEDGVVRYQDGETRVALSDEDIVSMNMFGFHHDIFKTIKKGFLEFAKANTEDPKAEYFIPLVVNQMINDGSMRMQVIPSGDKWYGVTYREDKEEVTAALANLTKEGAYPDALWG